MLTVELHAHSERSYDGRDPVDLLLEQAAAVGLDGLAVTDHDEIAGGREVAERAPDYGLVGIPGVEVTSAAGHVLALGVRESIRPGLSFEETVERIRAAGGVAVVPHPFQKSRSGVAANVPASTLAGADAIEAYNSRLLTGLANRRAERFARRHDLPMTAGSDAHVAEMIGQAPTRITADDRSLEAILDAVRTGRTSFEGKRTPWRISIRQAAGGVKRRVRNRIGTILD